MEVTRVTIVVEIMKKTAMTLILGLSLALTGFAQLTAKKPSGRTSIRKPPASKPIVADDRDRTATSPIVADDRDRATTSKSKPSKLEPPRPALGPAIIVRTKPQRSQLMMALDANEDGKLSLDEIKAAVEVLKALDENKDGELTLNEFGPTPELAKPNRSEGPSSKGGRLSSTLKAVAKPSVRPSRRPTAKPSVSPKVIAGLTPGTKRPSTKATRPSARPRPSARSRPISKLGQATGGDGTSAKVDDLASLDGASTAKTPLRRVARKAPARKVSKAALTGDPEIKRLIDDAEKTTKLIREATPKIENLGNKQLAQNWARTGYRAFLRSLNNIQGQDKEVKLNEAKQKLEEVRKLLQ